jgi:Uma2 family endonuclease
MATAPIRTKRWTRLEYERLVDLGAFGPGDLVEVADTSLVSDREWKGSLYARARVPEYWIVNLADRGLEVYRDPRPAADAAFGWRYTAIRRLSSSDILAPLGAPEARIAVADLLP